MYKKRFVHNIGVKLGGGWFIVKNPKYALTLNTCVFLEKIVQF